jgi:hypothetical protein
VYVALVSFSTTPTVLKNCDYLTLASLASLYYIVVVLVSRIKYRSSVIGRRVIKLIIVVARL